MWFKFYMPQAYQTNTFPNPLGIFCGEWVTDHFIYCWKLRPSSKCNDSAQAQAEDRAGNLAIGRGTSYGTQSFPMNFFSTPPYLRKCQHSKPTPSQNYVKTKAGSYHPTSPVAIITQIIKLPHGEGNASHPSQAGRASTENQRDEKISLVEITLPKSSDSDHRTVLLPRPRRAVLSAVIGRTDYVYTCIWKSIDTSDTQWLWLSSINQLPFELLPDCYIAAVQRTLLHTR